ncbi:Mu transposase C-terminal domain-containing protein [Octadecabacter sp. G9-8]|uniref:Mu transposase C-terminal domain-containing protein n=1 Tax=Octadecabacter dasysiphoniae TaxID=2909341 RepID=A0ABS9D046_9RHOB|nr:Mu transposase C-terminal domain-containing protein [Octadecabacter dasysiphoniae]MCF2872892.1 Mu transposase C-terminal domain-containing protein [Octadecabacter dasysiphoniae]
MTNPMQISPFARLTVGPHSYRNAAAAASGCSFERTDRPGVQVYFSFEKLRELLAQPENSLEPDYFLFERHELRATGVIAAVGMLPDKIKSEVVWRYAYVEVARQLVKAGRLKRTEFSVQVLLDEIERCVNKQAGAAQDGWVPKRAGRKKEFRAPPCAGTLLEWMRRYERAGNSPLGLVPRTFRSGNWKDRFSLEELRLLGTCIGRYLTRDRRSKRQVADDTRTRFDAENVERLEKGLPPLRVPSKRKVEREIAKLDPYSTYAQRHGVDAANREFMLYEQGIDASYPMERIEIDEWYVDLISILAERGALDHLSAEQLAELPRGRRWLYLAIDCATRCVVGMRLAVTPNSQDAIALLADITRDKTDLATAAGCKSAWAHFGGLKTVATDLGAAFVDDNFQTAIFDALGSPETPTGGLPQLRARVERIFGTFGTNLMPGLAGRTFSNPKDRGDYPSQEMASITDDALIQALILYVVDVYHNREHPGLGGETPNNCWNRLAQEKGVVADVPERTRRRAFGKPLNRKVTGRGVRVFGIDYTCQALRQFHPHSHETHVDLRIDLRDLGWIMVRIGDEWFHAMALQNCFAGVSYDEWQAAAKELRLKYRDEARLQEKIVAEALAKIASINAAEQKTFATLLRNVTPAGLARGEEDLFLGLSIDPEDPENFDLPPDDDLFGHVIPVPKRDDGGGSATVAIEPTTDSDADDEDAPLNWSFDDE